MKKTVIYIHGKGGNADEAEHYKPLFPDCEVIGFDYHAQTPWEAKDEFKRFFGSFGGRTTLVANSIGAFFAMNSLSEDEVGEALFISPIVDMEKLICDMMKWAGVSEDELMYTAQDIADELRDKKEIPTDFGETLSWEYLCYVRRHPVEWKVPTRILYGERDHLTDIATMTAFSKRINAPLTVMKGGEHWLHTEEQMKFLDGWIKNSLK